MLAAPKSESISAREKKLLKLGLKGLGSAKSRPAILWNADEGLVRDVTGREEISVAIYSRGAPGDASSQQCLLAAMSRAQGLGVLQLAGLVIREITPSDPPSQSLRRALKF